MRFRVSLDLLELVEYLLGSQIVFDRSHLGNSLSKTLQAQSLSLLAVEETLALIDPGRVLFHIYQGRNHSWCLDAQMLRLFQSG